MLVGSLDSTLPTPEPSPSHWTETCTWKVLMKAYDRSPGPFPRISVRDRGSAQVMSPSMTSSSLYLHSTQDIVSSRNSEHVY